MNHYDLVARNNVIYELYKAALDGEISKEVFAKVKEIVHRAKLPPDVTVSLKWKEREE